MFVYTKGGRAFRHTATYKAYSSSVDRTRKADELFATLRPVTHAPAVWDPILTHNIEHRKDHLVRDGPFVCLPGDDLLCQGLTPHVSSAVMVLTSVFEIRKANEPFATLRLLTHTPAVWIERVEPRGGGL
ncbi:MAG: hypothetical protein P4L59_03885, partial [Desulfosporosinus sp.]|nr:hypothetical protein [Desulfosporosinus sp.]